MITTMQLFSHKVMVNIVFLSLVLCTLSLLNACATQSTIPSRIPNLTYPETSQNAYLWTAGMRHSAPELADYATFTKIDGVDVPVKYLPDAGFPPGPSFLLEIPTGKHNVEILYKEDVLVPVPCFWPIAGCEFAIEKSRQTLTFIAEANHIYTPFADDECNRTWYWIEDWGSYVEKSETLRVMFNTRSDLTKPLVAGEAPKKKCE